MRQSRGQTQLLATYCLVLLVAGAVVARSAHQPHATRHVLEGQQVSHCTPETSSNIAEQWSSARAAADSDGLWSGCPSAKWIRAYHDVVKDSQGKVIVDIGSNKGYFLFRLLDEFLPRLGLSPGRIFRTLHEMKPEPLNGWCGDCSDCKAEPQHSDAAPRSQLVSEQDLQAVRVLSFEPAGPNFNALEYLKRSLFAVDDFKPEAAVHWSIFKMAVANFSGTAQFPAECFKEYCRLKLDGIADLDAELMSSLEMVPVITVDEIVAGELLSQGLATFDILKMDAQGFDPLALQGADATLRAQRPAIVQFTYSFLGAWASASLHAIVHDMHAYGYVCYLDGSPDMVRLSGCWNAAYEYRMWGQVVCARAVDTALIQALDALCFQASNPA